MQDRQYLALELTKIYYQGDRIPINTSGVMDTYRFYLNNLSELLNNSETIKQLQCEIDKLNEEIARLNTEKINNTIDFKLNQIKDIITNGKSDMEPYIYNQICDIIDK